MIELKLKRKKYTDKQTLGTMDVYKDNVFVCCFATLEQKWNNNAISDSCLPKGEHIVEHYSSEKYKDVFIIKDTEPRTYILIHPLNYNTQTEGCIGIGLTHDDINLDGVIDISQSGKAVDKLNYICRGVEVINIKIT